MFECQRCGSSYSATHVGVENCPRCQLRDEVRAPLAFRAFRPPGAKRAPAPEAGAGAGPQVTPAAPTEAVEQPGL